SKTVGEIASLCGYNDRMYFSKVFKERTGFSPKHYMMKNEKNKNFSKKN
ncbi:MAG: AraC family transcriptional regulator, partial [Clostridia bacterium]|nr:AraC family transcriptional regulator [Clostridia bacterium]